LIESGRAKGGGYAGKGLVFLGGLSDSGYRERREGYIRYLGHEMAHAWWSGASVRDWQDWINEGFAEFSALMLVRSIFGEESFRKRLENKRQNAADTAPIWGFERWDRSTPEKQQEIQAVLYDKGPVLLAELEERLGSETFLAACRDLAGHVEKNTSLLLEVISSRGGRDVASWFETQLRIR